MAVAIYDSMASTLFWVIIGFASLFLVMKSASYAIDSIIRYAKKTGLSYYFVGLLVVSIGTSLPELFTAIISSLEGNSSLMLGDAMGATIVDVTLVLAMVGIVAGGLKVSKKEVNIVMWKVMLVVILIPILALDGTLSRLDGGILLLAFAWYYGINIYKELKHQKVIKDLPFKFVGKEVFVFGANIAMLIFGTQLLVLSASHISEVIGIPKYIFGALILSVCTTSPEFIVELKALASKSAPIAFGDIFGSVICNMSLVVGLGVMISPIVVDRTMLLAVSAFLIPGVLLALVFLNMRKITRLQGITLFSIYIVFLLYQLYSLGVFL